MRKAIVYYLRWLGLAIWPAFRSARSLAGTGGIVFLLVGALLPVPKWAEAWKPTKDGVMLTAFGLAAVYRFFGAPYWMHQEVEKRCETAEVELDNLRTQLERRTRRETIRSVLGTLLSQAMRLMQERVESVDQFNVWKIRYDEWCQSAQTQVETGVSAADADLLMSVSPVAGQFLGAFNGAHSQCKCFLDCYISNIKTLMGHYPPI